MLTQQQKIEQSTGLKVRRGWVLDGAGPARFGWIAIHPCTEKYLGRTAEDVLGVSWDVQGDYGHGFECVCAEESYAEGRARLREYRANEPGIAFRLRRVVGS